MSRWTKLIPNWREVSSTYSLLIIHYSLSRTKHHAHDFSTLVHNQTEIYLLFAAGQFHPRPGDAVAADESVTVGDGIYLARAAEEVDQPQLIQQRGPIHTGRGEPIPRRAG
jgi:hypothetical protein